MTVLGLSAAVCNLVAGGGLLLLAVFLFLPTRLVTASYLHMRGQIGLVLLTGAVLRFSHQLGPPWLSDGLRIFSAVPIALTAIMAMAHLARLGRGRR